MPSNTTMCFDLRRNMGIITLRKNENSKNKTKGSGY